MDDNSVAHHFLLGHRAAIEPEQLTPLLERRVRVFYTDAENLIGHRAHKLVLLDC
jgi:hypothetical protein